MTVIHSWNINWVSRRRHRLTPAYDFLKKLTLTHCTMLLVEIVPTHCSKEHIHTHRWMVLEARKVLNLVIYQEFRVRLHMPESPYFEKLAKKRPSSVAQTQVRAYGCSSKFEAGKHACGSAVFRALSISKRKASLLPRSVGKRRIISVSSFLCQ